MDRRAPSSPTASAVNAATRVDESDERHGQDLPDVQQDLADLRLCGAVPVESPGQVSSERRTWLPVMASRRVQPRICAYSLLAARVLSGWRAAPIG